MKANHLFKIFLIILITFISIPSCSDSNNSSEDEGGDGTEDVVFAINDDVDNISVDAQDQRVTLTITSKTEWTVGNDVNWIWLNPKSGNAGKTEITLRIDPNKLYERETVLNFLHGEGNLYFTVRQGSANTGFESATHYFYATFGTMPSLYAGLHVLSHDKPSYFFYERLGTYDLQKFPSHVTIPPNITGTSGNVSVEDERVMAEYMKKKVLEINEENPNAIFGVYIDDLRSRISYDWFVAQGIDSSRVKTTLLTDGTGSYNVFYNNFGNASTAQSDWDKRAAEVNTLNWDNTKNGIKAAPEFESWTWMAYMSSLPNYRYFLQDANLFETESPYIKEKIRTMNNVSLPPLQILNNLSESKKRVFHEMVKFDKQKLQNMLNASSKKNLVIISTNPSIPMRPDIEKTMAEYSEEYDIFFSGHPGTTDWADYEERFPGLKLLPSPMPFEVFLWTFMDDIHAIGGFASTVFLTVPVQKVKFMYAKGPNDMTRPLNLIFKGTEESIDWTKKN